MTGASTGAERYVCPPDHAHAANSTCRAAHHCKCDACREGAREYEFWRAAQRRRGRPLLVDATGTVRRIRALQRLGWSLRTISLAAGRAETWAGSLARVRSVSPATAATVRALYDDMSMRLPPTRTWQERSAVTKARNHAERAGWPPPLAWDEDAIDDPGASPAEWKDAA